ncbi:MAG: hypothetical protein AOA66_0919 [Candidatus Bathyarchaeota archaeon BA2]|nr:MAG: hypothetical protein AOA66_0919 [Candidatus Bathyarchaeota archaeon BA2]
MFSATSVYSAMNVRISFGEPQVFLSSGLVVISIPLLINNTGLYDLYELNITVNLVDYNGSLVSTSTTFVPLISRGSSVETAYNISMNLDDITSRAQIYLFNDTIFNMDASMKLNFARVVPLKGSMNTTIPWGAPLYNFSVGQPSYNDHNLTHRRVIIPLSFENHSPYFGVDGMMLAEMYNDRGEVIASRTSSLDAPSHSKYEDRIELIVNDLKLTPSGEMHFYFETSVFSFGPVVMPYG